MRLSLPFALPDRRRVTSFLLALAIEALLIALLLLFGPHFTPAPKSVRRPVSFSLSPDAKKDAGTAPERRAAPKAEAQPRTGTPPKTPLPPVIVPPKVPTPQALPGVLPIQLGATDISKLKSSAASDDTGSDAGPDSKLAYGPGEGPGGQPLYNAEWYREPSDAELNGYLPRGAPPNSWALIACQTVPKFHVENCRSLGESPMGSGLARAMREAAWQFLVRPPRRGGKVLVGAWVKIRIDFTLKPVKSDKDDQPSGE
ncbi:MAG TPA: hypothetical protein VF409_04670 [Sphingomonas sp.]